MVSLVFAQGQFTFSTNGNYAQFFIDGNLQNQLHSNSTFLKVLNVPEGMHEVKIRLSNGIESSMSMYFLNFKDYSFGVKNIYGQKQLILNGMGNAIPMNPNGTNIVIYSSNHWNNNNGPSLNPNLGTNHNQNIIRKHPQMPDYNGTVGCYENRISESELNDIISKEVFADDQVSAVKLALKHNSIAVADLVAIMKKISFDDQKLELAKYAYDQTIDIGNFYKVGNAFTFSSNKQKLNNFIRQK
jgi:hypothetical protein